MTAYAKTITCFNYKLHEETSVRKNAQTIFSNLLFTAKEALVATCKSTMEQSSKNDNQKNKEKERIHKLCALFW